MTWKKHFKPVNTVLPYSGMGKSTSVTTLNKYNSWLPEVYLGPPNRLERYIQYEQMDIDVNFKYYLPVEVQIQLGLREVCFDENGKDYPCPPDPEKGYPGDTEPQQSTLNISDTNIKFVAGLAAEYESFIAVLDYNISKFDIFSFAILYKL